MKRRKIFAIGMGVLILAGMMSVRVWATERLSEEKIIVIAKAKAAEEGYRIDSMSIVYNDNNAMYGEQVRQEGVSEYDEATSEWKPVDPTTPERNRPKLKDRDYQAVYFAPKQMMKGGDFWVFVDRMTGEVIDSVAGQ